MATSAKVFTSLKLLKELDSIVDFSRSTNQLIIILYLFSKNDATPLSIISRELGISRKNILDSMRKLERKNLVTRIEKEGEIHFLLSETGRKYVNKLMSLLNGNVKDSEIIKHLNVAARINIGHELITAYRLYRALVTLGLSEKQYLHVRELAESMGLSIDRAKSYLDAFSTSPAKLFRRVTTTKGTYYKLAKNGLNILYKTPHYTWFKKNRIYRFLARLYKTPWPEEIFMKLQKTLLAASLPVAIITTILNPVISSIILLAVIIIMFIVEKLLSY